MPLALVGFLAASVAIYWPTLGSGFVYDSRLQILTDDFIHRPANIVKVASLQVLGVDVLDFNRPAQLLSLMLDALVWGRRPVGYHLTSILIHGLNAWMLFGIARRLTGGAGIAALAGALVFLAHPVMTDAVCEPSFREDLLVAMFVLGGIWLFAGVRGHPGAGRGRDPAKGQPATPPGPRLGTAPRVAAIWACALGAAASKETAVALPFLLILWALVDRRREGAARFPAVTVAGTVAAIGCSTLIRLSHLVVFRVGVWRARPCRRARRTLSAWCPPRCREASGTR